MTPEEAIDYLLDPIGKREQHDDAIRMAVEALEKQLSNTSEIPNSSDLISRRDAITAIIGLPTWYYDSDGHYGDPQPPMEALLDPEDVVNAIENLPPAKQEQKAGRWIPCSERLPENDERVLATTAWGDVTIAERIYPPINDTCWFIHDGNTNATIDDVVAWMPLPEPAYMEETNGKNV